MYPLTMIHFVISQPYIEGVVLRLWLQPSRFRAHTRTYIGALSHVTGSLRFRSSPSLQLEEQIASEAFLDNVCSLRFAIHKT